MSIIKESEYCSLLPNEGVDAANQELLPVVMQACAEDLEIIEHFISFRGLKSIASECIHKTQK